MTTTLTPTAESTSERLLRAAEDLFAENGVAQTSTRAILQRAGQRNESALQYHFGGREGLIETLYLERGAQVSAERERMMQELEDRGELTVRDLCVVALMPAVRLARQDSSFANFLKIVAQLVFLPIERLQETQRRYGTQAVAELGRRLRERLDLPERIANQRLELMNRMCVLTIAQWALSERTFRGDRAELYFQSSLDAIEAALSSPVSAETREVLDRLARRSRR